MLNYCHSELVSASPDINEETLKQVQGDSKMNRLAELVSASTDINKETLKQVQGDGVGVQW